MVIGDKVGVIVDFDVTTDALNEGGQLEQQIDRIEETTGVQVQTITVDAGCPQMTCLHACLMLIAKLYAPSLRGFRKMWILGTLLARC